MLNSFPELFIIVFAGMILFGIALVVLVTWLGLAIMHWATKETGID
jgi:hypothetical protein